MSYTASFNRSTTFGTKVCSIRELKTTIQAPLCDSCSHHLILFYRLGLYLFSTATFKKTSPNLHEKHSRATSHRTHKWRSQYPETITKIVPGNPRLKYSQPVQ